MSEKCYGTEALTLLNVTVEVQHHCFRTYKVSDCISELQALFLTTLSKDF